MTNAMTLGQYPWMNGSRAMTGVRQMRARVRMLGRVQRMDPPLAQRFQHHLADGLQGVEHAVAADRDGLEVGGAPGPLVVELLDQVLAWMEQIGHDLLVSAVVDGPAGIERRLEVANRRGVGQ